MAPLLELQYAINYFNSMLHASTDLTEPMSTVFTVIYGGFDVFAKPPASKSRGDPAKAFARICRARSLQAPQNDALARPMPNA